MSPGVRGTTTNCSPPSLPSRHSALWGKAAASSEQQTLRACTARRDHARYADCRDAGHGPRRALQQLRSRRQFPLAAADLLVVPPRQGPNRIPGRAAPQRRRGGACDCRAPGVFRSLARLEARRRHLPLRAWRVGRALLARDAGGVHRGGRRRHGREVHMTKGRLEAFTDGVIAVIITIMVLEMKVPHDADPSALAPLVPVFLSYLLSFVFTGIYWNNHHHMFHAVHHVNGATLWANLHLLFWLSLVPFVTGWMDENHFAAVTVAAYGIVLLGAACAYTILTLVLLAAHGKDSPLARALGKDFKGKISIAIYVAAIPLAFVQPQVSGGLYVLVAAIWLCPDRRFEKLLDELKA